MGFDREWHNRAKRMMRGGNDNPYYKYRENPQGFFRNELGTSHITASMDELMHAMLKYQFVVVKSATGTGKSYTLAGAAVWLYKTYKEVGVYTAAASPLPNLKKILWGEIGTFAAERPELFEGDRLTDMNIERAAKEYITGLTIPSRGKEADMISAFSGKHHPDCIAFFFDEGDGIPDPCYIGADGCLSGGGKQLMVIALNPKKREGYPYSLITQNRAHVITMSAYDHPNVVTGREIIKGAVDRPATVRRINEYAEPLLSTEEMDENCFILPDFLVGEVGFARSGREYKPLIAGAYHVTNDEYWYKVEGKYPPLGMNRLISETKMSEAVERWKVYVDIHGGPPENSIVDMGFDVADTEDNNSLCFRYGSFVDDFVVWSGFDTPVSAKKASEYYHRRGCRQAFVDAIGVGSGIPYLMSTEGKCSKVIAVKVNEEAPGFTIDGDFDSIRDYAYLQMANWINNDPTAMLPDNERLIASLRVLKRVPAPNDRIRVTQKKEMRSLLGFSPDEMESLMLTFAPKGVDAGSMPSREANRADRQTVEGEMRLRRLLQGIR